jgi:hypothetical protein
MEKKKLQRMLKAHINRSPSSPAFQDRKAWHEPKLEFIEPKLTKQGKLEDVTGGYFGSFYPRP